MIMLKSTHKIPNLKFLLFMKIASFIILTWLYPYYYNQNAISKSLENGSELNISLDVRTHRSLAKSEQGNELNNIRHKYKTSNYGESHKLSYINNNNNNNTYENIKRGRPNHMEVYFKSYNSRYTKEKGIKKLDCYCEKKLFKSLYKIDKLKEQKNISKSRIKRIIFTMYGLLLFIISLLPLLSLAIRGEKWKVHPTNKCKAVADPEGSSTYKVSYTACDEYEVEDNSYRVVFISISTIIILLFIIYIFIKIMKYNRIKSGMLK